MFDHLIVERLFCRNNISTNTTTTTNPNDDKNNDCNGITKMQQWEKMFRDYETRINDAKHSTTNNNNNTTLQEMISITNSALHFCPASSTSFFASIFRLLVCHPLLFHIHDNNSNDNTNDNQHPFKSCVKLLQDFLISFYNESLQCINRHVACKNMFNEL